MLSAGFCTAAEVKRSVGISSSDTTDDTLIEEIIRFVSGQIERRAGRPLRREYGIEEFFTGGKDLIHLRRTPVVAIHSVRESVDRNFIDTDEFEELVEDEDYILDDDINGRGYPKGFTGRIRRLEGPWMGGSDSRRNVKVNYTAGYKLDAETALENTSTSIGSESSDDAKDYVIRAYKPGETDERYLLENRGATDLAVDADSNNRRIVVLRFGTRNTILPTWAIHKVALQYKYKVNSGATPTPLLLPLRYDPLDTTPANLKRIYDVEEDSTLGVIDLGTTQWTQSSYTTVSESTDGLTDSHANVIELMRLFRDTLSRGFIAFKIEPGTGSTMDADVAGHANATAGNRPLLTVEHAANDVENYPVNDDLRHAAIMQAAHVLNEARKYPGLLGQSIRGVSIASGVAFEKLGYQLLPGVADVADRYARLY
ncbi:MAG: hypothetical protein KIPDCIKN_04366 [Haliscomenobacter sp.]|nr:hypothetical protein [Haliscomenobacter sp.]